MISQFYVSVFSRRHSGMTHSLMAQPQRWQCGGNPKIKRSSQGLAAQRGSVEQSLHYYPEHSCLQSRAKRSWSPHTPYYTTPAKTLEYLKAREQPSHFVFQRVSWAFVTLKHKTIYVIHIWVVGKSKDTMNKREIPINANVSMSKLMKGVAKTVNNKALIWGRFTQNEKPTLCTHT